MSTVYLFLDGHRAHVTNTGDAWTYTGTLDTIFNYKLENEVIQFSNAQKSTLAWELNTLCNANQGNGDCDYIYSGLQGNLYSYIGISPADNNEINWYNQNIAGKELNITINTTRSSGGASIPVFLFKAIMPTINTLNVTLVESTLCRSIYSQVCDGSYYSQSSFTNYITKSVSIVDVVPPEPPESECEDLRTSESTQGCYLTANWVDVLGNQFSEDYTLLFQPDSQTTSGSVSMSSSNFKGMMGLAGVTCRFNQGVVRDSGYIKINGHIKANKYTVDMLGTTLVPVFNEVTENFIIQFTFEPCCDYPSVISETYTDAVEALRIDGADLVMAQIDFDSIEWHGFALLTDYCCDNIDCDGLEFENDDEPLYKGVGGGGDTVDITCICDNLALINTTLANKFDGLNGKMDSLIETIEEKEFPLELDECICDNLEAISNKLDSLDDIKDSIDNKIIPVTDVSSVANAINSKQIPITDVSGITTAINNKQIPVTNVSGIESAITNKQIPVTNVSGIESAITNKQIPVTDVSGLNTSLGNIDSSLGQIDNTIAGGTASIGTSIDDLDISLGGINTTLGGIDTSIDDVGSAIGNQSFTVDTSGLTCTDSQGNEEGLACILKNALNNRDNKGLADVIDDKDVTSYVDVAIEPYDMVNIRRAFKDDDIQEG